MTSNLIALNYLPCSNNHSSHLRSHGLIGAASPQKAQKRFTGLIIDTAELEKSVFDWGLDEGLDEDLEEDLGKGPEVGLEKDTKKEGVGNTSPPVPARSRPNVTIEKVGTFNPSKSAKGRLQEIATRRVSTSGTRNHSYNGIGWPAMEQQLLQQLEARQKREQKQQRQQEKAPESESDQKDHDKGEELSAPRNEQEEQLESQQEREPELEQVPDRADMTLKQMEEHYESLISSLQNKLMSKEEQLKEKDELIKKRDARLKRRDERIASLESQLEALQDPKANDERMKSLEQKLVEMSIELANAKSENDQNKSDRNLGSRENSERPSRLTRSAGPAAKPDLRMSGRTLENKIVALSMELATAKAENDVYKMENSKLVKQLSSKSILGNESMEFDKLARQLSSRTNLGYEPIEENDKSRYTIKLLEEKKTSDAKENGVINELKPIEFVPEGLAFDLKPINKNNQMEPRVLNDSLNWEMHQPWEKVNQGQTGQQDKQKPNQPPQAKDPLVKLSKNEEEFKCIGDDKPQKESKCVPDGTSDPPKDAFGSIRKSFSGLFPFARNLSRCQSNPNLFLDVLDGHSSSGNELDDDSIKVPPFVRPRSQSNPEFFGLADEVHLLIGNQPTSELELKPGEDCAECHDVDGTSKCEEKPQFQTNGRLSLLRMPSWGAEHRRASTGYANKFERKKSSVNATNGSHEITNSQPPLEGRRSSLFHSLRNLGVNIADASKNAAAVSRTDNTTDSILGWIQKPQQRQESLTKVESGEGGPPKKEDEETPRRQKGRDKPLIVKSSRTFIEGVIFPSNWNEVLDGFDAGAKVTGAKDKACNKAGSSAPHRANNMFGSAAVATNARAA